MRETTMKRNLFLVGLALGAAVSLVGCSQSSPTAPKQPTPSTYGITITVSPSVAGINESITAVAMVTVGGAAAPDGTRVAFTAAGSASFSQTAAVQQGFGTTSGGGVAVQVWYLSSSSGSVGTVTATVPNKSATATVHFTGVSPSQLAITSVLPNRGKPQGGDQVVISGQGFTQPLVLSFVIGGTAYPATVVSVAADGSSITALTPQVPSSSGDQLAGVRVVVGSGAGAITANLPNAFTFGADTGVPQLYSVVPNSGSSNGGDIVTLTGKYFTEPLQVSFVLAAATVAGQVTSVQHGADGVDVAQVVTPKVTIAGRTTVNITITNMAGTASSKTATFNQVFTFNPPVTGPPVIYYISPTFGSVAGNDTVTIFGANFAAPASVTIGPTSEIVQSISADGTSMTILTRAVGGPVPTAAQDVTVTTAQAPPAVLSAAFTYLEGQAPTLYVLTPNIGPLEGGTRVTITGSGFQYPVQVLFNSLQAQVVSNNFNQIVCISPSITATQPGTPPITYNVTVTNIGSGKVSNGLPFQYGQSMFVSSIAPGTGPDTGGTTVTIFGQGFVAPLAVSLANTPAQVLSVAGTQIVAASGAVLQRSCSYGVGDVVVTNIDSKATATGSGLWTYTGAQPLITSVTLGAGCSGGMAPGHSPGACTITINGSKFESGMRVSFSNPASLAVTATFVSPTQITIPVPDFEAHGIAYLQVACILGGQTGTSNGPTAIDVTVTNTANGCSNTLPGGLVVNPSDTTCHLTPLAVTCTANPATGIAPLTVAFNATPSGGLGTYTYSWNFGDGSPLNATRNPSHTYPAAGSYTATVTVSDGQSAVTCSDPITAAIATLGVQPPTQTTPAGSTLPITFTVSITPAQVASISWFASGTIAFVANSGTVSTNSSGLAQITLTPQSGSLSGQNATITFSSALASQISATVTVP